MSQDNNCFRAVVHLSPELLSIKKHSCVVGLYSLMLLFCKSCSNESNALGSISPAWNLCIDLHDLVSISRQAVHQGMCIYFKHKHEASAKRVKKKVKMAEALTIFV